MSHRHAVVALLLCLAAWAGGLAAPLAAQEPPAADPEAPPLPDILTKRLVLDFEVSGVEVHRDLPYLEAGDGSLTLDLYLPPGLKPEETRPGVVFFHGGPLPAGLPVKATRWGQYLSYGDWIASSGFVAATVNFRYPSLEAEDLERSAEDILGALAYLRRRAADLHLDRDRLCVWTVSGGGIQLTELLRDPPPYLRCLVAYYTVMSPEAFAGLGMTPASPEVIESHSPGRLLDARTPPILLARAGQDLPAINQSLEAFLEKALARGVAVDFYNHPAGVHGFDVATDDERSREILRASLAFLRRHLSTP